MKRLRSKGGLLRGTVGSLSIRGFPPSMWHYVPWVLLVFAGIVMLCWWCGQKARDGFTNTLSEFESESESSSAAWTKPRCPNMLVQKGSAYYLFNSSLAFVPGVNPVQFDTLAQYDAFLGWQKSQGIHCPVLFLQQSYDTEGQRVYYQRPSPFDLQAGLMPVSSSAVPPTSVQIMDTTPFDSQDADAVTTMAPIYAPVPSAPEHPQLLSDNAMDDNWGGVAYTQRAIDSGKYDDNNVSIQGT